MWRSTDRYALGPALAPFALVVLAIGLSWWWLGAPIAVPPSPLGSGYKLFCISYAPFRADQSPLVEGTHVEPAQIDADLALLSKYSDCVRTYSVDFGLDQVAPIARRYGLKVIQGLWLSSNAEKNQQQIATAVALAKDFPDVITSVVVGNEVLLRGEMSVSDLIATIRRVKAQVPEPVTYADVWEYWLRYRDVANAVDFVTIHILPYWEDFPLPAAQAAAHVDAIRKRVAAAFPNKEIMIGEVGWPSAGRMREGALPSPANQARVIDETLALAQREHFRVNVIEAFDQPWKRWLEGSVGGHWGIFDRATGAPKFSFSGGAVSNHPDWPVQALAGILLTAAMFAGALVCAGKGPAQRLVWWMIGAMAFLPAVLLGWTIERIPVESFSIGGWLRSLALAAVAVGAPIAVAMGLTTTRHVPVFSELLSPNPERRSALQLVLGLILVVLVLLAIEVALGLVFDPRYRDIPFAPLCGAVIPYLALWLWGIRRNRSPADVEALAHRGGARAQAETVAAITLALAAIYIAFNESFANWQAVWLSADLLVLAVILALRRGAPG